MITPWGKSRFRKVITEGVSLFGTDSHGGMKVNKNLNKKIPYEFRKTDGWYEEDCEIDIPLYFLYDEIAESFFKISKRREKDFYLDSIKRWFTKDYKVYMNQKSWDWENIKK